ncbi:PucR family transcriptional regulator [Halalkalibacillus sediminis]|uniref:PucR family transcriptional regulator n=1 Tax=Halalkalibacillus sediminis TaxID=2018042 RepID=A0A2I0QVQ9_9BACI|nr:PucR family transcriptional regulator [Halalkalibacillus sediminis]PKR78422.1 PucR family transcriptional regulator [Halalkalibacillus sediminis]
MGIRMDEVMRQPFLEEATVVAGNDLLEKTLVEWVSVMEVPVENFIRKHEFVLSTGLGCADSSKALEEFVKDVIHSGASALTIATGKHVVEIPQSVVKLANEQGFILIEIPWKIRFSDIIQEIVQLLNDEKENERHNAEQVRQQLTDCVLNGGTLEDIISRLHEHIEMPVAISDQKQKIRANCDFDTGVIDTINGFTEGTIEKVTPPDLPFSEHPLYYHLDQYDVNNQRCYELTIYSNAKKQGYLLFMPDHPTDLTWYTMNLLEHGLTACALYFLTENAVELTEIRLKDNFVLSLAKEKQDLDAKWLSKGELLGYDLSLPYVCIVGQIRSKDNDFLPKESERDQSMQSSLHSLNYYVQKEITHASQNLNRQTMSTFDHGEIIIFLEIDHHPHQETVNHFLDMIDRRLHDQLAHTDIAWGIALHQEGFQVFNESYQEARTALDIHIEQHGFGERTFFEDTRVNRILLTMSNDTKIVDMMKETIGPLIEYDQKRETDLVHTFMTYQKYKGNVSQTSRALNLHRQSLLYRLRNIENLTKLSLIDADDSFLLELSVRLWLMHKIK